MTPTEVLKEIRKMPISSRRQLRDELNEDLETTETNDFSSKEKRFIEAMMKKGLISEIPNRFKRKVLQRRFERVNVIGKPISQTIIEDRG